MSTIDSLAPPGVQPEAKPAVQEAGAWGNSAPLGLAAFAVTTFMLSNLEARAPSVDRATLWIDSVTRGTIDRKSVV